MTEYLGRETVENTAAVVIAASLAIFGVVFIASGLILHSVSRHFQGLTHRLMHIERDVAELKCRPATEMRDPIRSVKSAASGSRISNDVS
jgi:hypothetical protein